MKNKLTLSELRNVIKEEIQFQLTKKQLFENLDRKTLRRILNEGIELPVEITKSIVPANNWANPIKIVNPNQQDVISFIPTKFTTNQVRFNFKFFIDIPDNMQNVKEDVKNEFLKNLRIFNITPNTLNAETLNIFDYTKVPAANYNGTLIMAKRMELSVFYPEAMTLPKEKGGLGLKLENGFDVSGFAGKKSI